MNKAAPGIRLSFDYGSSRIGVARSDAMGILATPLKTLSNVEPAVWGDIDELIDEFSPCVAYVGYPVSHDGGVSETARSARRWAIELASHCQGTPVHLVDERFTSSLAESQLRAVGKQPSRNKGEIDARAATILLQGALDFERIHGAWAGSPATPVMTDTD
jgi:putative Holliday junction resolvase